MNIGLDPFNLVVIIAILLISLTLHEAMHAYVGLRLGDTTALDEGRVSFNPLKHIDPFATLLLPLITIFAFGQPLLAAKPVPFNPERVKFDEFGAALIAVAGPLTNLLLALVGALVAHIIGFDKELIGLGHSFADVLYIFSGYNILLFVFNLIPIPPLDGSRVLFAFAPEPIQELMTRIEPFGFFIVFGLVLLSSGFGSMIARISQTILLYLF